MRQRTQKQYKEDILDEQEQDDLIAGLRYESYAASKIFRLVTSAMSLFMTMVFAYASNRKRAMVTTLSITSLVVTCYTLRYLPNESHDALDGPLANYLPYLNTVLAGLVLVVAWLRSGENHAWSSVLISLDVVPILVLALSAILRHSAAQTERSISALERKKYNLKGA